MGFGSLQHSRNPRSTCRRPKPARYVPPSGFGYPLDGLLPRIPRRFCFAPAAPLGFTLRRFPLPRGFQNLSAWTDPPTVSLTVSLSPKRQTGLTGLDFWGHASRKCLATERGFKPTITGAFLGFRPSRVLRRRPRPGLLRISSHALCRSGDRSPDPPAPQSLCQPSPRSARCRTGVQTGRSNPSGVFAPARS
jgi:hypothetical protein